MAMLKKLLNLIADLILKLNHLKLVIYGNLARFNSSVADAPLIFTD